MNSQFLHREECNQGPENGGVPNRCHPNILDNLGPQIGASQIGATRTFQIIWVYTHLKNGVTN